MKDREDRKIEITFNEGIKVNLKGSASFTIGKSCTRGTVSKTKSNTLVQVSGDDNKINVKSLDSPINNSKNPDYYRSN
ncbi:hypothetical protein [Bacillus sp. Marseille-P3661]|uniref:hypothetical protein n=1 Tax=Bacillus sp. Marseille-P3661 TaxID=1936234 RepID=UPI000C82DD1B|nr:hypothetical protein [Bacillus sp. Marseille-P3661]